MLGTIIKNGVIIACILGLAFLSQQHTSKIYNFPLFKKGEAYNGTPSVNGISDWLKNNVYDKVSGEVAKRQALLTDQATQQKNSIVQNSVDGTKKFIAEKFLQSIGVKPEDLVPACKP